MLLPKFSVPEVCEENYSKKQVDSILSLCEEYSYNDDLFINVEVKYGHLRDIAAEIESLNDSKINKIKRDNEKVWEKLDDLLTNSKILPKKI